MDYYGAKAVLETLLPMKYKVCERFLYNMIVPAEGLKALQTYFPEEYGSLKKVYRLDDIWKETQVEEDVIDRLNKHIPMSDFATEWLQESDSFMVVITSLGFSYDWDTFDEDMQNPHNLSDMMGPDMLVQFLNQAVTDEEYWVSMSSRFGWDIEPFEFPPFDWYYDQDELYKKFRQAGRAYLQWIWKMNIWETGTIFLDINLYDEVPVHELYYSPSEIPILVKHANRAKRILRLYKKAGKRAAEDPDTYQLMARLFGECIHERPKK